MLKIYMEGYIYILHQSVNAGWLPLESRTGGTREVGGILCFYFIRFSVEVGIL